MLHMYAKGSMTRLPAMKIPIKAKAIGKYSMLRSN